MISFSAIERRHFIALASVALMVKPAQAATPMWDALSQDDGRGVGHPYEGAEPIIVELMDYACGYCKAAHGKISEVLAARPKLRLIRRDLPILGPDSITAAACVMSAGNQGKALLMHDALMKSSSRLKTDTIIQIAQSVGVDTQRMSEDISNTSFQSRFVQTLDINNAIKATGTPTYTGKSGKLFEGFGSVERFIGFVNEERKS